MTIIMRFRLKCHVSSFAFFFYVHALWKCLWCVYQIRMTCIPHIRTILLNLISLRGYRLLGPVSHPPALNILFIWRKREKQHHNNNYPKSIKSILFAYRSSHQAEVHSWKTIFWSMRWICVCVSGKLQMAYEIFSITTPNHSEANNFVC